MVQHHITTAGTAETQTIPLVEPDPREELEIRVLGSLLHDTEREVAERVVMRIRARDFADPAGRTLFAAAKAAYLRGRPPTFAVVTEELALAGRLTRELFMVAFQAHESVATCINGPLYARRLVARLEGDGS